MAVVAEIQGAGGRAERITVDLRAADGPHLLAERVRGIAKAASISDITIEDFDALFAVNVRAPYFLVQQLSKSGSDWYKFSQHCDNYHYFANQPAYLCVSCGYHYRDLPKQLRLRGIIRYAMAQLDRLCNALHEQATRTLDMSRDNG